MRGQTEAPPALDGVAWETTSETQVYNLRTAKVPRQRALCLSEDGVRRVVDWLNKTENAFSIQSGGHCYEGLSQHNDIIVDLSALARTELQDDCVLVAQPGAHLSQANDTAALVGKALPAGYCQQVALGGHVCGGGIGILARSFGLTCDNLLTARVVTSDAHVTIASRDENPDLFWALRGGGSGSFGIITQYTLHLHEVADLTLADYHWTIPLQDAAEVLQDIQEVALTLGPTQSAYLYLKAHSADTFYIRLRLVSLGADPVFQTALQRISRVARPMNEPVTVSGDYRTVADAMWPRDHNPRHWIKNKSLFFEAQVPDAAWEGLVQALSAQAEHEIWVSFELLGGQIDAMAPDETAYVHRQGPSVLVAMAVTLSDPSDPTTALAGLQLAFDALQPAAMPGTYVNYPDLDLEDWQTAYWGSNYPRLAAIKREYDPQDFFHHAQSVRLA